eukprot:TRINITY_DN3003_c0_g1_i12.p1 TRINITY_DN3003_c0_g1~~TRINITY_DN3003_c0_g1_i12.p1  ORF type:complete len:173 (-),score=19.60 TRINITY_DN3003_c0_g1_i12:125-643(-)
MYTKLSSSSGSSNSPLSYRSLPLPPEATVPRPTRFATVSGSNARNSPPTSDNEPIGPPPNRCVMIPKELAPANPSKCGLVEVFCVDISRSMWLSQSFPYVLGKSKLNVAIDIISKPVNLRFDTTSITEHFSCLVTFSSLPKLVIDFDNHSSIQVSLRSFFRNFELHSLKLHI